ncbi:MFS transporter [Paraburkholderia megapolitana]|uniref:Drug resistance transporter, EmrB/QacA subfamily n=1 Tax=Paraburkholderia megapolitana TaxID=420953 RepID=A0A1I3LDR8_9BURK|nr:MFS transporter [Paraburkholderia megapolitana]QDQ80672.1 MFS transporter [Paraburkholderia megapolitana]SFI82919.1 drug resistance transporter, EmrB/QacA subfamily [Paraburkholderia megapolitana]
MADCALAPLSPATTSTDDAAARRIANQRRLTLALVASGMFMAVLDTTIVNVALPALRADLHASVGGLAWIVDAYTLSFAALILAGGLASDRFGAKTVYLWGLALFVGASAACGLAPTVGPLIVARFVQGMGAALFLPASLAIVRSTFEDPRERARAIAMWAGIASVAASIGPVAGGVLVDGFGWRSAFLINVPTGLAALAGAWIVVRSATRSRARRFDWGGQLASMVALGALCYAAIELPTRGPASREVWVAALVAGLAALTLIAVERRAHDPMVPVRWFRNRVFVAMNLAGTLVYIGYFGLLFVLSLYLHGELGLNARQTGLTLLPLAASLSLGNLLSGKLHGRFSATQLMASGLGLAACAVPAMAALLEAHAPWLLVYGTMVAFGMGTALSVAPMISTVLEQVPAELAGVASGLLNALRQSGSLFGVAIAGAATILAPHLSVALWVVGAVGFTTYAIAAMVAGTATATTASKRNAAR